MKRLITLHVVRLDTLLHALGGFAEPAPLLTYFWTSQEDEYLRQAYTFAHMHELSERLPRRTPGAIRKRACDLGVTRPKRRAAIENDPQIMRSDGLRLPTGIGATPLLLAQDASASIPPRLPPSLQAPRGSPVAERR